MSRDHAQANITKRDALFRLLSDLVWHAHHELAAVGGVRYSARLLELKRLGYTIDSLDASDGEQGKRYRMPSTRQGEPQGKRVKVFLEERDVVAMTERGFIPPRARAALADAHASFDVNRSKL